MKTSNFEGYINCELVYLTTQNRARLRIDPYDSEYFVLVTFRTIAGL